MNVRDVVEMGLIGYAAYLGVQLFGARSTARVMQAYNPASPFAAPGRPVANPQVRSNISLGPWVNPAVPPGYTWNDEAGVYHNRDSENVTDQFI